MRYFKKTFMWVIILTAIAGYSYFDYQKTKLEKIRKDDATKLFPFEPLEVLSFTINKEGSTLELERWDDGWRIVSPMSAKADDEAVEKFLGHVTDSRNDADYVMDENPAPERLVEFGLANPTLSVTFKTGKELNPYTIVFGDRAPTMGVAFAKLKDQKPVYRVLAYMRAEANKDIYYFRDKTVLRLNPVMIDQLAISRKEGTIRLKLPTDGKWRLEKPVEARADYNKVFELMGLFTNAEVKEFVAENKNSLQKYGLDKPAIELLFWASGDAQATVRIKIGERDPGKRGYFLTMSDRDNVFLLDEDLIHSVPRFGNDLRSKELFFFERNNLKRIELRKPDKSLVLVKDVEKEWRRNNERGGKVDFNLVREFLDGLMESRIKHFVSENQRDLKEFGLDPPSIQLLMWPEKSAVPIHLSIGSKTPAGYIYARTGSVGSVLALDKDVKRILTTLF